ncbi:MAG: hypothetical protein ACOX4F_01695 [Atopobiaceae bacterium]|jgi:hypothetical protein
MALDLNQELHLPRRAGKKQDLPSKTDMNLLGAYRNIGLPTKRLGIIAAAGTAAVVLLAVVLIAPNQAIATRQATLSQEEEKLASAQAAVEGYDELLEEYWSLEPTVNEAGVSGLSVLDVVESDVASRCSVVAESLSGQVLTLTVTDVDLAGAGEIANALAARDDVVSAAVSGSSGGSGADTVCTLTVTFESTAGNNAKGA